MRERLRLTWAVLRTHATVGPGLLAGSIAGALVAAAGPLASTVASGRLVGGVADGDRGAVISALWLLAAIELAQVPLENFRWAFVHALGQRFRAFHHRRRLSAVLGPPGIAHMHDPDVADALEASDNAWVVNMLEGLMVVGVARLYGLGAVVVLAFHEPVAALILGAAWGGAGIWLWGRSREGARVVTGQTHALRRAGVIHDAGTRPELAKEVRVFGLRSWLGGRFSGEWWSAMSEVWQQRARAGRLAPHMTVMLLAAHVVALVLIARSGLAGRLGPGDLAVALQAALATNKLGSSEWGLWEIEFGFVVVPELERLEGLIRERGEALPGTRPVPALTTGLALRGVRFRYPGSERDVLAGVDLDIRAGQSLAVVGDNGAGKTTLMQLLARVRDPSAGTIAADGIDLCTVDATAWQDAVSVVAQGAIHLPLTAHENVAAGRSVDRASVESAARAAGASEIVAGLEHGWDTVLSREFGGGAELSGGQWQRIALARALAALDAGAQLLILDEPTAHLDVRAEADLYDRFLEITRGRTVVLVSHRFSTVRRADQIAVLDGGRVVELGSHEELMQAGGRYARMFSLQASRFGGAVR